MARRIMGTRAIEAICPLCDTGYYMTCDEVHFITDNKKEMAYFWCDVCERQVKVDPNEKGDMRPVYLAKDFWK